MTRRRRDRPAARPFVWIFHFAAAIALVAALSAGRWADVAASVPRLEVVPGVATPICHAPTRAGTPRPAGDHACCDDCVLAGAALPPVSPQATVRGSFRATARLASAKPVPVARSREPRQARAPPVSA